MTASAAASRTVMATAILFLSLQSASAFTGAELWEHCQGKDKIRSIGCTAYIRGLVDGFVSATALATMKVKVCIPKAGVSVTQARLIIEKFLRENPQHLHQEAGLLAMTAMADAFSCDNSTTSAPK